MRRSQEMLRNYMSKFDPLPSVNYAAMGATATPGVKSFGSDSKSNNDPPEITNKKATVSNNLSYDFKMPQDKVSRNMEKQEQTLDGEYEENPNTGQ
jgi:hypothetical protein